MSGLLRRLWIVACLLLAGLLSPVAAGSISPRLAERIDQAGSDEWIPIVVMMEAFPSQAEMREELAGLNRDARRAKLISRRAQLVATSQRPVRDVLDDEASQVRKLRVLWGINGLALEARPPAIARLAALPGVRWVLFDRATGHLEDEPVEWVHSVPPIVPRSETDGTGPTGGDTSGPNPAATVPGEITVMGAEQVWNDLGFTGAGVVVAVIDTGVDPDHPDLADHIWTNLDEIPDNGTDDDGNGYVDDTWGWDFCLGNNDPSAGFHGTQVAGQVAGDGTNGIVTGMAPDAEIMSLGIDCDTPSISWEASDYAIANGAHLITQSYSWWWTDQPDYEGFRRQADTELAAGVLHVNSGGNGATNPARPIPYNISTPSNCPAPWTHPDQTLIGGISSTLAVGNIDWSTDIIDASSSLGPSAWEDIQANTDPAYPHVLPPEYLDYPYQNGAQMGLIKPDLSAYGDGTTTTCPGTSYCGFSGTSSAAPHVSGTAALMLSSNPEATPAELAEILMTTAEHRGDPGKNNVYGTGLVQAHPAVLSVQSGVFYESHTVDDASGGNGDLSLDPGELASLAITVRSVEVAALSGLEAILSTSTPGVTIHNAHADYPSVPAGGLAASEAPHFSLSIDPSLCSTLIVFNLELRFDGLVRNLPFAARVGDVEPLALLSDDFETDQGWVSDPGTATFGQWVREDPIGTTNGGDPANPEDDSSDPGVTCWVTGNGGSNNDVDGGEVVLLSPIFGAPYLRSLQLSYDHWYYDDAFGGDSFKSFFSVDGGQNWTLVQYIVSPTDGWEPYDADLFELLPVSETMQLKFVVTDGSDNTPVEGAVDEVHVDGIWVHCQDHVEPIAQAPNPVGNTLLGGKHPGGHVELSWQAPPVDPTHDAATRYRFERADSPAGPFLEIGVPTAIETVDVDALTGGGAYYYRVRAENSGGVE